MLYDKVSQSKCLLNIKAINYTYLEWFARLIASELKTCTEEQGAKTPVRFKQTHFKMAVFMGKSLHFLQILLEDFSVGNCPVSVFQPSFWMGNAHLYFHYFYSGISSWFHVIGNFSQAANSAIKTLFIILGSKSLRWQVPLTLPVISKWENDTFFFSLHEGCLCWLKQIHVHADIFSAFQSPLFQLRCIAAS